MSRIGKSPIVIPKEVSVTIDKSLVVIEGSRGKLLQEVDPDITCKLEGGLLVLERPTDQKRHKALHGLYRSLLKNNIEGVSTGFKKELELVGVGYKVVSKGNILELNVGYSHSIFFQVPDELKITTVTEKGKNPKIILEGSDKQLLGQVAAKIRTFRKIEPYKGKGIKFVGEQVRRKAGKTAAK